MSITMARQTIAYHQSHQWGGEITRLGIQLSPARLFLHYLLLQVPWGRLPAESSFGWVGRTNFGSAGQYSQFSGDHRVHGGAGHQRLGGEAKDNLDGFIHHGLGGEVHVAKARYHDKEQANGGHAGYVHPQDNLDHGIAPAPDYDYNQLDGHDDNTFVPDSQQGIQDYTEQDRNIVLGVDDHYLPTPLDDSGSNIFAHDELTINYDDGENAVANVLNSNDEHDRHIFELEYDHSGNDNFLLQGSENDFSFNSNEIYISEHADDELSRHERGFNDVPDHFLGDSFENDDPQGQPFGFEEFEKENGEHEGFGQDDLFFKQKVDDRSSDLEFNQFYEKEKNNDYGYSYGQSTQHRGYPPHLRQNGQQRSSQEFADIFGGRKKSSPPVIIPGF